MDLINLTIAQTASLLARREISPLELTRAHLERIQRVDGQLNCFITLTPELALQQARQAEAEIMAGDYKGALHGIPLALKDLFETVGVRTTAGSAFFAENISEVDAVAVQRRNAARAVLLGKLNMHEIALGVTNENPHFGDCCNPHDLRCIPGGSSGGSGAALAAGLCQGSLGTDTGGSIRIPASLCGVVGLKPTRGRVSLRGVVPLSWNLDHAGPMARCVRDVALLLQAIAGYDPEDPYSINALPDDYLAQLEGGVRGWRVALASDDFFADSQVVNAEVLAAVQQAGRVFESLGAQVEAVPFPNANEAAAANSLMTMADGAAFHSQRLAEAPQNFGDDVLRRLKKGAAYTVSEYSQARHTQATLRQQFTRFLEGADTGRPYDLLLTPATPIPAPLRGSNNAAERASLLTRFTAPFNLTGLPALALPCGLTQAGLPLGLQIVGQPWAEARLLQAGYAYEQANGLRLAVEVTKFTL